MFSFFKKKEIKVDTPSQVEQKTEEFSDSTELEDFFKKETGITFEGQKSILKSKLSSFCRQREIYSFHALLTNIKMDTSLKQELINHLTTNETYFYREFKQIQQLIELVKESSSNVSILCAPSATGEEPYSIAISLLEAGVPSSKFTITGIDINAHAIEKSQQALYHKRNLRNLSEEVISKYFVPENDHYLLSHNIRPLVSFKVANIFDPSFKNIGKFDFVFSRNMLIYFDKETKLKAKKILEELRKNETHDVFFGHADLF